MNEPALSTRHDQIAPNASQVRTSRYIYRTSPIAPIAEVRPIVDQPALRRLAALSVRV